MLFKKLNKYWKFYGGSYAAAFPVFVLSYLTEKDTKNE